MPEETAPVTETAPVVETPPAGTETTPPAGGEVDPWDDAEVQTFDRTYVEKLRNEAAGRRTALKPYEDAFGGYSDQEREWWTETARILAEDPAKGAERMLTVAQTLLGTAPEGTETAPEDEGDEDVPMTKKEMEAFIAQRETEARAKAATEGVKNEAKALGYTEGSWKYDALMSIALNETKGDLKAAHEAIVKHEQGLVDSYVEQKRREAEGTPTTQEAGGSAPANDKPPKSFADARASLEARLAAMPGA